MRATHVLLLGLLLLLALGGAAWWLASGASATRPGAAAPPAPRAADRPASPPDVAARGPDEAAPAPDTAAGDADVGAADAFAGIDPADLDNPWAAVDLDAVRAALPENLYWTQAMPTRDPRVLEERAAEAARWNAEYGKVLSGTASEEEIRAFYNHRYRVSTDYVEFSNYLIDHYGDVLPERDLTLLHLSRRLHLARLEEVPRRMEEAFERKRAQDAAREAWLADEAAFEADRSGEPPESD